MKNIKKMLFPLVEKFRAYVTRAKICTNPEELVRYIGKDNFEELVDIVNHSFICLSMLPSMGLLPCAAVKGLWLDCLI